MFFTRVLQMYKRHRGTSGLLRAGKHRAMPFISVSLKRQALRWLMLEQANMEVLSKPYLTEEEECGSTKAKKRELYMENRNFDRQSKMLPHRTSDSIFGSLYKSRSWE